MLKRSFLYCGSIIAVTASLGAAPAFAATATAAAGAVAADSPSSVTEVTVIAQKREEKIESVPVAVSAFSGKQRSLLGIQTVQDLTDYTPGLSFTSVSNRPYVRGVGRNTDNLSTASAVATYVNGIYYGANASTLLQKDDLFIGNIEVDRGPQNSIHGSNADGGTISYTSQRPTNQYYAEVRGGAANYGSYFTEGVVSGPITDNIKFRLGANYTDMQGGYFHNLEGLGDQGGNMPNGSSGTSKYFEGQIEGHFDKLDVWAMASAGDFATNYHTVAEVGNIPDSLFLASNAFEPSGFFGLCGLPGVIGSATGAGCANNSGQSVVPGSVVTDKVTANQFPGNNPGNLNARNFIQEYSSTNYQNGNLALATNVTYHLPSVDVTYLGGYQSFDYELNYTTGADAGVRSYQLAGPTVAETSPLGNLTVNPTPNLTYFAEHDHFWSHEVDFTSTWDGPFQYVAGAYWYHEKYDQPVDAGVEPNQAQMGAPDYISGLGGGPICAGGAPICAAPANPSHAYSASLTDLTYNSYAGFVSGSYKFNDQLKFNGAVRYTSDNKEGVQQWRFTEFNVIPGLQASSLGAFTPATDLTYAAVTDPKTGKLLPAYQGAGATFVNGSTGFAERTLGDTWTAVTGEGTLTWTPDRETLFYGRYARGYKSGGFSTYTIGADPETTPEYVDSYEIGAKKTIGRTFTINGAAFYYNYYDDQVPVSVNTGGQVIPVLDNLPLVHDYGVELEGIWRPIDPLTVSVEYSYLNTSIADAGGCLNNIYDPLAQQGGTKTAGCGNTAGSLAVLQNVKGNQLPEATPNKITANALYTFDLPTGKLTMSGTVIWKDTTYGSIFNEPEFKQDPYSQVNLRATYASGDGHYNIILFCDNLFNTNGFDAAIPALMNEVTTSTDKEDILNGYSLTPPRTFGVQLQYRFK